MNEILMKLLATGLLILGIGCTFAGVGYFGEVAKKYNLEKQFYFLCVLGAFALLYSRIKLT